MITGAIFIAVSLALLVYWFRYTCLMILSTRPAQDFARVAARRHGLNLMDVQASLSAPRPDLDALQQSLDADYARLTRLMRDYNASAGVLEEIMLKTHYAAMHSAYAICRRFAPAKARIALAAMADTVTHFAAVMGEQGARA